MSENKKVVVKTLDTGMAKPIPISQNDAINIARAQNENNKEVDIPIEENKTIEETIDSVQEAPKVVVTNQINNNANISIQQEKLNEINDLVKVEKVKKENPKIVLALVLILAVIIIGFFVFELPVIIEMLNK